MNQKQRRPPCRGGAMDHIGCVTIQSHPTEFYTIRQGQAATYDSRPFGVGGRR